MIDLLQEPYKKQQINQRRRLQKQHRNHKLMTVHDKKRQATKMYLTIEQAQDMENTCGTKAAYLHSRYVDMAEDTTRELNDIYMANIMNWSITAIQRARLALEKGSWFRKFTGSWGPDNLYSATYYLLDKALVLKGMSDAEYIAYLKQEEDKKE